MDSRPAGRFGTEGASDDVRWFITNRKAQMDLCMWYFFPGVKYLYFSCQQLRLLSSVTKIWTSLWFDVKIAVAMKLLEFLRQTTNYIIYDIGWSGWHIMGDVDCMKNSWRHTFSRIPWSLLAVARPWLTRPVVSTSRYVWRHSTYLTSQPSELWPALWISSEELCYGKDYGVSTPQNHHFWRHKYSRTSQHSNSVPTIPPSNKIAS